MLKERVKIVLVLFAIAPLLIAGGGSTSPGPHTLTAPVINAHVVMDPHDAGTGTGQSITGRQASIRLTRGARSAAALFTVPSNFPFAFGCDLTKTDIRFGPTPPVLVSSWIDTALMGTLLQQVFTPAEISALGVATVNGDNTIITSIDHVSCTPANTTGILSFHARMHVIRFGS